jgi:predicted RNA-binding protein YlqC (UPF0109 family)
VLQFCQEYPKLSDYLKASYLFYHRDIRLKILNCSELNSHDYRKLVEKELKATEKDIGKVLGAEGKNKLITKIEKLVNKSYEGNKEEFLDNYFKLVKTVTLSQTNGHPP